MNRLTWTLSSLQFFFVFVVWAAFFCLWTLATLIGLNVRAARRQGIKVESQQIVTIALYLPFFFRLHPRI
jgi:ABC-type Fe3+-siderophore transport system permease subunit